MPFEKLVCLCKQISIQFRHVSLLINKSRSSSKMNTSTDSNTKTKDDNQIDQTYEIDNSSSPTQGNLFLNDESNLTITGDIFNKSANIDCSGMDLEHLDDSLTQSNTNVNANTNNSFNNAFKPNSKSNRFNNIKALTSTVSAQRTQSQISLKSNMKSDHNSLDATKQHHQHTVKFSLKSSDITMGPPNKQQLTETPLNLINSSDKAVNSMSSNGAFSYALSIKNSCAFSRKIAEYFVAQQAHLIENNEHEALSPVELEQKIDELISYDSSFSDAYYLKYLNFLRLRDYPSALKALHDYFDRLILAGSASLAALNLSSLEFRFDSKENALFALKEAITSAHQEGDIFCLQHCLVFISFNFFNWSNKYSFVGSM